MNDQPKYQCCDSCTSASYVFVVKDDSVIAVCDRCYERPELREVSKEIWNSTTGKLEVVA